MFGLLVGALKIVSFAVSVIDIGMRVCKTLNILKKDMPSEELGDRALQAQEKGIKISDYEGRYDEYIKEIENVEVNPESSNKFSSEQKNFAAAQVLGMGLLEHFGKDSGVDKFIGTELVEKNKDFYNPDRVVAYMETFKAAGLSMETIGRYLDSKLESLLENRNVDVKLVEAEQKLGLTESQAQENLDAERSRRSQDL